MIRTRNSIFNMITKIGSNLLLVVLDFAIRSLFIYTLGATYLGIEGYFSNILTMLSLTELGFGSAIVFKLYKPIEENDYPRIRALMAFYRKVYIIMGCIIMGVGLCLIPLLPLLIKDYEVFSQIGLNAAFVFVMYLFKTASTYWFFSYKTSFVTANQKSYYLNIANYVIALVSSGVQIVILLFTKSFILYLSWLIAVNIFRNLIFARICDRLFPYIRQKAEGHIDRSERRGLFKDCGALLLHQINGAVLSASDNLVLTAVCGLEAVGYYSVYLTLKTSLQSLLYVFSDATNASIGSLYSTGDLEGSNFIWRVGNYALTAVHAIGGVGIAVLANEFITVWPGVGADYVVTQWVGTNGHTYAIPLALLVGSELYVYGIARCSSLFRLSFGLFQPLKYRPIASMLVNLAVTILLVPYLGMAGCVIGTIVSTLTTDFLIDPRAIHKYALKTSPKGYYIRHLLYFGTAVVSWLVSTVLCRLIAVSGFIGFILHGIVCAAVTGGLYCLFFCRTEEFRYLWGIVMNILHRKRSEA